MKKNDAKIKRMMFSAEMAQAINDGRKSMTRRMLKYQTPDGRGYRQVDDPNLIEDWHGTKVAIPYQVGDIIAVCEPWQTLKKYDSTKPSDLPADAPFCAWADPCAVYNGRKRLARFMPMRFVRNFIRVTSVVVKRLQDIGAGEMRKDGVGDMLEDSGSIAGHAFARAEHASIGGVPLKYDAELYGYAALYDSLNGPGTWESNPWMWVIEFEKLDYNPLKP